MPARKPFLKVSEPDNELLRLLEYSKSRILSEEELREQRISFAFGNALGAKDITKDSVRKSSMSIRLQKS